MWKAAIAVALLLAGPNGVRAASYLVRPNGTGDFPTIQDALFAAASGDTILLSNGTFTGPSNRDLSYQAKALVVQSESGNPANCTIDCQGAGRGLYLLSVPSGARLIGVTVTHGVGDGSAVYCSNSSLTIDNCVLTDNGDSQSRGGAVYCVSGAHPILSNCTITLNQSSSGGGVYASSAGADLIGCQIENNTANAVGGGGVSCNVSASILLSGCTVRSNHAIGPSGEAGGVYCGGSVVTPSTLTVVDCDISGNDAVWLAGGLFVNASFLTVTNTLIAGNTCGGSEGGGVYVASSNPLFTTVTFAGNHAGASGGALSLYSTHATFDRCIVWGNCSDASWDAVAMSGSGTTAAFQCSDVTPADVGGTGSPSYDANCFDADPLFCAAADCVFAPDTWGFYALDFYSPAAPGISPCGSRVGALDPVCITELAAPATATGAFASRAVPNPTTGGTELRFAAPAGPVSVTVYDAVGRVVRAWSERHTAAGDGATAWDGRDDRGRDVPAGVYFYRLRAGGSTSTGRVVRLTR